MRVPHRPRTGRDVTDASVLKGTTSGPTEPSIDRDVDRNERTLSRRVILAEEVPRESIDVGESLVRFDRHDVSLDRYMRAEVVSCKHGQRHMAVVLQVFEAGAVGVHAQHEMSVILDEVPGRHRYGTAVRRDRRHDGWVRLAEKG